MTTNNEKQIYTLNDDYSVQLGTTLDHQLKIELYQQEILTANVHIPDQQCSILTRYFCETSEELYELLHNLLLTTGESSIRVTNPHSLKISFPIFFGKDKSHSKTWSFHIILNRRSLNGEQKNTDITLDPQDWTEIRSLGHQIMDDMIDYTRDVRLRPTWQPTPLAIKQTIRQTELPLHGQSPWEVYKEVCSLVLPYPVGNHHPKFWGYVQGTGSSIGAFAELITATLNSMSWGGNQSSIHLESQVLSWMKDLVGFPNDQTSSGVLVTGTSVATIIALAVARRKFLNRKVKIYSSNETHNCLLRAIDLLNMGRENIVLVPTNNKRQIDIQALEAILDPDACGILVGTAGTVGTGSIDDLQSLADLCARRPDELWFHIDGAIGAVACCSPRLRPLFKGIERADSIAFDLHKWLSIPYDCGCILIRDGQLHRTVFSQPTASYLTLMNGGITPSEGEVFFCDYGLELSRGMKSLKVWMTLKTYGIERFGQIMEQNIAQVQYFAQLIEQHPEQFEILTTSLLNIVCFRCIVSRTNPVDLEILNRLNKQLLVTIQERGIAVVSPLVINNETFALRMCIVNHRTKMSDMEQFMSQLIDLMEEFLTTDYAFLRKPVNES